MKVGAVKTIII